MALKVLCNLFDINYVIDCRKIAIKEILGTFGETTFFHLLRSQITNFNGLGQPAMGKEPLCKYQFLFSHCLTPKLSQFFITHPYNAVGDKSSKTIETWAITFACPSDYILGESVECRG